METLGYGGLSYSQFLDLVLCPFGLLVTSHPYGDYKCSSKLIPQTVARQNMRQDKTKRQATARLVWSRCVCGIDVKAFFTLYRQKVFI